MKMESYLNSGIKEVCTDFPEIGKILEEFDVGCNSCLVGTCLLKVFKLSRNIGRNPNFLLP